MMYNKIKCNNLSEILNTIREQKGLSKEELIDFVNHNTPLHNAYLLNNMDKAIDRLKQAIFDQQPICIIGDYDVDGLTATTIMYKTFINFMPTYYLIPNRLTDGYGISKKLVDEARKFNVKLLITVDNGISGQEAINYAQSLGMEIIVTDHHIALTNDFPANITINPQIDNYPFKGICGCMVAYKLCTTLLEEIGIPYNKEEFIELTTLATIADVMPLIDENRTIVYKGLKYLENAHNIGLKALIDKLKVKISVEQIAWYICPCINASGRMETPNHVMDLFLSNTIDEANNKADYLIDLNKKRKEFQDEVMKLIQIDNSHPIIIAHIKTKISGIAGIIASKIQDIYNKPSIAVGGTKILSGSGRSNDFPLDLLFKNCDLITGGGHRNACGISFKSNDLESIQTKFDEIYNNYIPEKKETIIDVIEIDLNLITKDLINAIDTLEPFGYCNEPPLFITKTTIDQKKVVGANKNCTQFVFSNGWVFNKGILFDLTEINEGDVEVVYTLQFNEFPKGVFTPQMVINKIKPLV